MSIAKTNEGAALQWEFPGVLQYAGAVTGGWADLVQAVASFTVPATNTSLFFRVRKPLFTVVDTAQTSYYNNSGAMAAPSPGQPFYGQDPEFTGPSAAYTNNGNGTITDLNTGLMWIQARGSKMTWAAAVAGAATQRTGGHADWRMPTIKELYSLIKFNGVNGPNNMVTTGFTPFITPAPRPPRLQRRSTRTTLLAPASRTKPASLTTRISGRVQYSSTAARPHPAPTFRSAGRWVT